MSGVLAAKDVNASMASVPADAGAVKPDVKSMEYHRQVLQSKMEQGDEYVFFSVLPPLN